MGILYLVRIDGSNYHKIGITWKDTLDDRFYQLQNNLPFELIVLREYVFSDPYPIEQDLLGHLKTHKLRGEWFDIDTVEIQQIVDLFVTMQRIDDTDDVAARIDLAQPQIDQSRTAMIIGLTQQGASTRKIQSMIGGDYNTIVQLARVARTAAPIAIIPPEQDIEAPQNGDEA